MITNHASAVFRAATGIALALWFAGCSSESRVANAMGDAILQTHFDFPFLHHSGARTARDRSQ